MRARNWGFVSGECSLPVIGYRWWSGEKGMRERKCSVVGFYKGVFLFLLF